MLAILNSSPVYNESDQRAWVQAGRQAGMQRASGTHTHHPATTDFLSRRTLHHITVNTTEQDSSTMATYTILHLCSLVTHGLFTVICVQVGHIIQRVVDGA